MEQTKSSSDFQIPFWIVLGPLVLLATLVTGYLNPSSLPISFLAAALGGLVCSYIWKLRGAISASLGFILISLFTLNSAEWYWTFSLETAVILSFFITALSKQEIDELFLKIHEQIPLHQDKLQKLEELYLQTDQERLELLQLTKEQATQLAQLEEEKSAFQTHLIEIQKQNQKQLEDHQHQLHEKQESQRKEIELLEKQNLDLKQNHKHLSERLEHHRQEIAEFVQKQNKSQQEKDQLQQKWQAALKTSEEQTSLVQALKVELAQAGAEVGKEKEKNQQLQSEMLHKENEIQNRLEEAKQSLQQMTEEKKQVIHMLKEVEAERDGLLKPQIEEKESLPSVSQQELKRAEGLYKQMRAQFEEKGHLLDLTRQELFQTQEKLTALQRTQEEQLVFGEDPLQRALIRQLIKQERSATLIQEQTQQEIHALQDFISALLKS